MTDPAGGMYRYSYDVMSNLSAITYPDGKQRSYLYNEQAYTQFTKLEHALTGIIDENGSRFAIYAYDTQGRAISTEHAGGADKYTLSYGDNTTTVTDPFGTKRTYTFQIILGVAKNTGVTEPCTSCGAKNSAQTYDAHGNVIIAKRISMAMSPPMVMTLPAILKSAALKPMAPPWHAQLPLNGTQAYGFPPVLPNLIE